MESLMPGMPILASEHGGEVDLFMVLIHVMMIAAFLGWGAWFAFSVVRFRRGKHPEADYAGMKTKLPYLFVALMTVAEFALLLGMALPFWHEKINAMPKDGADVVELRVVAQQFRWNVHYPGPDGVFGRTDISLIDDQLNPLGLDKKDPDSEDDITIVGLMHLPVDKQALIHLSTMDMVHSFFLPEFRVKQDAIPGMRIPIYFTPTMTTQQFRESVGDERRNFEIACAQLCGLNHYTMRGFVTIESQEAYQAWYQELLEIKREYADDDDWSDF